MNARRGLASLIWVAGFNLSVALIAIYWGIGWSIAILCLRHILFGIPKVYDRWRDLFITSREITTNETANQKWPNRGWLLVSLLLAVIAVITIIWFNIPLKNVLFSN